MKRFVGTLVAISILVALVVAFTGSTQAGSTKPLDSSFTTNLDGWTKTVNSCQGLNLCSTDVVWTAGPVVGHSGVVTQSYTSLLGLLADGDTEMRSANFVAPSGDPYSSVEFSYDRLAQINSLLGGTAKLNVTLHNVTDNTDYAVVNDQTLSNEASWTHGAVSIPLSELDRGDTFNIRVHVDYDDVVLLALASVNVRFDNIVLTVNTTDPVPVAPTATTQAASDITHESVKLHGTVNTGGSSTSFKFEYGTTTAYGATTSTGNVASGSSAVTANITGLAAATTYHYRLVATNAQGTNPGSDMTFTTSANPGGQVTVPTVDTTAATGVTASSARMNGTIETNGAATTFFFEYGLTAAYSGQTSTGNLAHQAGAARSVTGDLTGLTANTTYHYRLVAENSAGRTNGPDKTFETAPTTGGPDPCTVNCGTDTPVAPPTVDGPTSTSPSAGVFTMTANINPNGSSVVACYEWGFTTTLGNRTTCDTLTGRNTVAFTRTLTGLPEGVKVYYRLTLAYNGQTHNGTVIDGNTTVYTVVNSPFGRCTIIGTAKADTLVGTAGKDIICGRTGNDVIQGMGGHDVLFGEQGNDKISGGAGNDKLFGGIGHDQIFGDAGNDAIYGEAGNDALNGGLGNDMLRGLAGNDRLLGANGNDRLIGDTGNDVLRGGAGNDQLGGGAGKDVLYGDGGSDILVGGTHADKLYGGAGRDKLNSQDIRWKDLVVGGAGADLYRYDRIDRVRP